jgi:hypothetical protein
LAAVEEAAAPDQVSDSAAASLAAVEARVPAEARVGPEALVAAPEVRAAEVAPLLMREICGARQGKVAEVERRAWAEAVQARAELAQAAPAVLGAEVLELALVLGAREAAQEAAEPVELAQAAPEAAQVVVEAVEPAKAAPEAGWVVPARKEQLRAGGLPLRQCCEGQPSPAAELRAQPGGRPAPAVAPIRWQKKTSARCFSCSPNWGNRAKIPKRAWKCPPFNRG